MKAQQDYAYVNLDGTCLVCGKKGMCTFGSAEDDDYHTWAWGAINLKTLEVTPV